MSSFESSYENSQPTWSLVTSALASVFDSVAISNDFTCDADLVQAAELYSLPRVDVELDNPGLYERIFLGAGASYTVYRQKFKQWDKAVAIKYIKSRATLGYNDNTSLGTQRLTILREIHSLCLFKEHPNIINLLAWGLYGAGEMVPYLITDYAPLGSLDCFLREYKQGLNADCLFQICLDVADGIHAMHSQKWIHGDVKTANILIFEGDPPQRQFLAKLSDLGFSMSLVFDSEDTCYRGTDFYNAPEVRSGNSRTIKDLNPIACDVYSLGLLIWTAFKHGAFFLEGVDISVTDDSSDEQLLDSISASQILGHALKFANARESQDEAGVLHQVFSACLQVDDRARLPVREIRRLLALPLHQLPTSSEAKTLVELDTRGNLDLRPRAWDIFKFRRYRFGYKHKIRLAQKLLTAAETPLNPMAPGLAFEVSKCFAVGFGHLKNEQSMEYWLSIAANRGHKNAQVLISNLNISGSQTVQTEKVDSHETTELDSTTTAPTKMQDKIWKAQYNHINQRLLSQHETYLCELDAVRSVAQKALPEELDNSTITCISDRSIQMAHDCVACPLLHWAAGRGHLELLQTLLENGADIDGVDPCFHRTPLLFALLSRQTAVTEFLIRKGADAIKSDRSGRSTLEFFEFVPPEDFASILGLLTNGEMSADVLSFAAEIGHVEAVKFLLKEIGHDLTAEQVSKAVEVAAHNSHASTCEAILCKVSRDHLPEDLIHLPIWASPFRRLKYNGRRWPEALRSTVKILLSYGFDINGYDTDGETAIGHAVGVNEPVIASILMDNGAYIEKCSKKGQSPLHHAIQGVANSINVDCVRWLLECEDSLVLSKQTREPLHVACKCNAYGAVGLLLELGKADINARSSKGFTPLHLACLSGSLESVQVLLEYGADTTLVDEGRFTPLELAANGTCLDMVKLLLRNNCPVFNKHRTPPCYILEFYAILPWHGRTRIWRHLLEYTRNHFPNVFCGEAVPEQSLLGTTILINNYDLVLDLIDYGATIQNPHSPHSEWRLLMDDGARLDHLAEDPRRDHYYMRVLQAFVEIFRKQGVLESRNAEGETLLFRPAMYNNVAAVTVLLDAGLSALMVNKVGMNLLGAVLRARISAQWEEEKNPQLVKRPGNRKAAKARAVVAILKLLLDAGVDPKAPDVAGTLNPLQLAVLSAWQLESPALLELLCQYGANPNLPCPAGCYRGVEHFYLALEAPTCIQALGLSSSSTLALLPSTHDGLLVNEEEFEAHESRYLELLTAMIRVMSISEASFDAYAELDWHPMAEAAWKCNPLGLRAMLVEGVPVRKALGIGISACHSTAISLQKIGNEQDRLNQPRKIGSAAAWMKARMASGKGNAAMLTEYGIAEYGTAEMFHAEINRPSTTCEDTDIRIVTATPSED